MMQRFLFMAAVAVASANLIQAHETEVADSLSRELHEVVVTANQPATKLVGTTLVSTITGSGLQNLGTALDVLAQLPMINVNDDEVTVTGKGVPEIFIDGRPMGSADELQIMRADNMKKVELLMAPGAMYASDTRAVLKITTRRNFVDGLSVVDKGEVVARRKWSANNVLDMNYRVGKWDFFASGLIARNNSLITGVTTNRLMYNGTETVVGSSQHKEYPSTTGVIKAGVNFSSGSHSAGGYYRYNPEHGSFSNDGVEWIDKSDEIKRVIETGVTAHSHHAEGYYDGVFADKWRLHVDGDFRKSYSANDVSTEYPQGEAVDVSSADKRKSTLWAGKIYLQTPLWGGDFTVGSQDSYTHTTLDYKMFNDAVSEYVPSAMTDARQISVSAFAEWKRQFGKFDISAGVRYEYVDYLFKLNGKKDDDVSRRDNFVTPDFSVGYNFSDEGQVSLSYKMATLKPPYSHLTGSLSYVGMHEIEGGNASLRDERMHDVQLFGMWKGFMIQADYTRSLDSYAFVKSVYEAPTLQLLMRPVNIDVSALNVYLMWSKRVKWWTPNVTVGLYKQWLELGAMRYRRPIFSYYLDNMISLPGDFIITLNASGQTEGDMHTNRFGTTWFTLDASVGKSFLKKSLQLKLSATDVFNTRNNDWTMNTCGIMVDKRQRYDRRGVSLSVTYRFQPQKSKYKGEAASKSEMNRL